MGYDKQVKITKDDMEATVNESSVGVWERNGWTRADDGSSEEAPAETETTEEG